MTELIGCSLIPKTIISCRLRPCRGIRQRTFSRKRRTASTPSQVRSEVNRAVTLQFSFIDLLVWCSYRLQRHADWHVCGADACLARQESVPQPYELEMSLPAQRQARTRQLLRTETMTASRASCPSQRAEATVFALISVSPLLHHYHCNILSCSLLQDRWLALVLSLLCAHVHARPMVLNVVR